MSKIICVVCREESGGKGTSMYGSVHKYGPTTHEFTPVESSAFHIAELDGKRIAYTDDTVFRVQVSKGNHTYRDRYRITGNFAQAVMLYNGINIGNGYNKRLYVDTFTKPVLARQKS